MESAHTEGILGLSLVLVALLVVAAGIGRMRLPQSMKTLVLSALAMRVVGSVTYYALIQWFYGGGDYVLYYEFGQDYARRIGRADFSMFYDSTEWLGGHWWSTQFVCFCAGIIAATVGSNILTAFILFSVLAFVGLVGFVLAFRASFPEASVERYARWAWLFPSLWFWTAALGKDALLLCGLGVATWGFVGRAGRINWLLLSVGILAVFCVRPQVAAVTVLAIVLAQWAATANRWSTLNTFQGIALVVAGLWVINVGLTSAGSGGSVEEVTEYVEGRAAVADRSGTTVGDVAPGWSRAPVALVNILFRPLPWEVRSATGLIASLEIWGLWALAFAKRRNIMAALREWRSSRLLSFSIIFVLVYAAALGMVVVNLGIIARQRIVLFPLIFLLFEAKAHVTRGVEADPGRRTLRRPTGRPAVPTGAVRPLSGR